MGYRRGYYRKDGTYVQGHYTKSRTKSFKSKSNRGCAGFLAVLFPFGFTLITIINRL